LAEGRPPQPEQMADERALNDLFGAANKAWDRSETASAIGLRGKRNESAASFDELVFLRRFQIGVLGKEQSQRWATVVFTHGCLKIGRGQILRVALMRAPFDEEAVANAAEQSRDEHAASVANPATVVVVRSVQTLVQAVFDAAKASSIEFQPPLCIEPLWFGAGQQSNVFLLAALGLAQQAGGLCRQGKADLLSGDRLG
jgi:hypothetical protein